MLFELKEIFQIGFFDGLRWFPFVLTVGLLYRYLKFIDISIDGIAIISSICFTYFWNTSHSIFISFFFTAFIAIILYMLVSFLIYELKINNILAGIVLTLTLYSISVILIGESLPLDYAVLTILNSHTILIITMLSLAVFVELFLRTNIGTKIRVASDNIDINVLSNPRLLILGLFTLAGLILSFGVTFYTSNLGLSRSGGGFEFLITSLSSYLFVDRVIDVLIKLLNNKVGYYSYKRYIIFSIIESPVFKSIVGSILFQIIVLLIIYYTSNPAYWKLIFGLILLVTIAKPEISLFVRNNSKSKGTQKGLLIKDLFFSYDNGYEKRNVFNNLNCHFYEGVNIIWGANGVGKTSLLKILGGELKANSGFLSYNGKDISFSKKYNRSVFYITQNPFNSLSTHTTVFENIIASRKLRLTELLKLSSPRKSLRFIDNSLLNNSSNGDTNSDSFWVQNVTKLSGGQAQKLNLLISSVSNSDIILADEPTSGMDDNNFEIFINFIHFLAKRNKLIIIVTHDNRFIHFPALHYQIKDGQLYKKEV